MLATKETLEVLNRLLRDYDHGNLNNILKDYTDGNLAPVIRCKDCKWCNKEYYGEHETEWVWYCPNVQHMVGDEWFCADGEKIR